MNVVSLLCEIIAQGGKVSASFYRGNPAFTGLMHHRFLRRSGVVPSIVCNDCDTSHAAEVVFEDQRYGYHCPDLGFVPLAEVDVRAVQADLPRLVEHLADTFDCARRKPSPLHDQTWRIGVVGTDLGGVSLYFQPRLESGEDTRQLEHALSGEIQTEWKLVITARGAVQVTDVRTVCLDNLVEFNAVSGVFKALVQPANLVGVPRKNPGGRPSEHGPALAEIIAERMESGEALEGVKAEARAIQIKFEAKHPGRGAPTTRTIKRHMKKSSGGTYLGHNLPPVLTQVMSARVPMHPNTGVWAMTNTPELITQAAQILAVSPNEAARLCGIGRTTLYAALSSGELKSVEIGTRRLIMIDALRDWLLANQQNVEK